MVSLKDVSLVAEAGIIGGRIKRLLNETRGPPADV